MKLYRINKLARPDGAVVKKRDIIARDDRQALNTAAEIPDCPVCEVWSEGKKVGSIR